MPCSGILLWSVLLLDPPSPDDDDSPPVGGGGAGGGDDGGGGGGPDGVGSGLEDNSPITCIKNVSFSRREDFVLGFMLQNVFY